MKRSSICYIAHSFLCGRGRRFTRLHGKYSVLENPTKPKPGELQVMNDNRRGINYFRSSPDQRKREAPRCSISGIREAEQGKGRGFPAATCKTRCSVRPSWVQAWRGVAWRYSKEGGGSGGAMSCEPWGALSIKAQFLKIEGSLLSQRGEGTGRSRAARCVSGAGPCGAGRGGAV